MTTVTVTHLTKRFGNVAAVEDLSFRLEPGTITGFLGPNGAGKTTTLRMLLGLVAPTSGNAFIGGLPYRELDDPLSRVGALLGTDAFHPSRTARDHLEIVAVAGGIPRERVDEVLGTVGLTYAAQRKVKTFSLGMKQRLGIATALLGHPDVLLLDEPVNGLDPEGVRWIRGFLRQHAADGGTVLLSSHLLSEVAQTVDHVVIIVRGRLVQHAPLDDLVQRSSPVVRVRTPDPAALLRALADNGAHAEPAEAETVLAFDVSAETVGLTAAGAGIAIYEMTTERLDLEDAFLELTRTGGSR